MFHAIVPLPFQFARHVGTNLPLPPIPGWRSLGFGADAPGNTLGGFPVFLLNFSTPNKIWTAPNGSKYLEPDYFDVTDVDPTGTGQPVISCTHHSSVASLYSSSGSTLHGGLGLPLSSPTALQSAYFQNANTATVCVGQLPLYQAQLPSDTPLSRFGLMMANALPPSYSPSSSGVFSSMFRSIGTNAVRSVTMGGVAVVVLRHGGCLTSSMVENMSKSDVQTWASRAMSNIFNGDTWSTGLDPTFVGATEVASQTLTGGNPETKLPAWKATVVSNPVPITWTMDNLYSVFPAPGSSVLQQAVDANAAAAHTAQAAAVKNATAAALANWLGKQQMYIKMSMKTQSMYENKTWTTVTPTTLAAGEHSVAASVDASTNPLTVYVPDGSNNDDYRLGTCIRLGGTSITLTKFAAAMCKRHSDGTAEAVTASLPDGKQSERTYEALFVPAVSGHKYGCTGDKTKYEKGKDVDIDVSGSSLSASASAALPACVITDTASYTVSGHHTDVRAQLSIRSKCCIGVEPNDKDGSLKCRPL